MARSFHQYSPRAQVLVCAVLSIGALGAAWKALIEPARAELKVRRARMAAVQTQSQRAAAIALRLPEVQEELASLEAALRQTAGVLSDQKDAQAVLRGLHRLASESNLHINSFTPKPGAEREQYTEWPIEVGLEGGYHDLARFFDRVASYPRLISMSNLILKADPNPAGSRRGSVHATCVATTFAFPPVVSSTESGAGGRP